MFYNKECVLTSGIILNVQSLSVARQVEHE
jgi:hypothetical protein